MLQSIFVAVAMAVCLLLSHGRAAATADWVRATTSSEDAMRVPSLGAHQGENALVADTVAAIWHGTKLPDRVAAALARKQAAVYVGLRRKGRRLAEAWSPPGHALQALRDALGEARRRSGTATADTLELVIAHDFEPVPFARRKAAFSNLRRGLSGIELRYGDEIERRGPTQMIASNRSFVAVIERFAEARGLDDDALARGLRLRRFEAEQFLVSLLPTPSAVPLFRGNQVVGQDAVTREAVTGLARRMADWMIRNVAADGRMTYKYWPSRGRESASNNMIRQWMATLCLVRLARFYDDPDIAVLAERNIRYNLKQFFRQADGFGAIEHRGKAKLGAMALAALALAEHPNRRRFEAEESALRRSIESLWSDDGSFRTFLRPPERNDNQNFYPGEALLYLATLHHESGDEALQARILRSVRHYRTWHLAQRNPAFVPWHSMAYALLWRDKPSPALRNWIFRMNDWLLAVQQTAPSAYPDIDGRFYDPQRPHFGPPHASSTGVYLEGLVQAFRVARESGERRRADAYRLAILRGLRSLLQLELRDEVDLFYIGQRDRARGALRTTVYNNEIRIDNVQHGLMALLEILTLFEARDFDDRSRIPIQARRF